MKKILTGITLALVLGSSLPSWAAVTGQWDFNSSNLTATVGTDLADFGLTPTTFTTATINGEKAVVMGFPAADPTQGYIMTHGVAPNGGGGYANQYTLIMDIMYPAASSGTWRGLFQTRTDNSNDGDLFINDGNGIGISASYSGTILPDTWHRVAFVVDSSPETNRLKKYIDGALVGTQSLDGLDGRWAMDPTALLFTDNDGETAPGFVNSIQVHDVPLTDTDIFALGNPTAAGIPATIPVFTNLNVTVTPASQADVAGMNTTYFRANAVGSGTYTHQWYRNGSPVTGQTNANLRILNTQTSDSGNYVIVVNNGIQSTTSSPPSVLTISPAPAAFVTGQWDFNQGDLSATFGEPLQYFDATVQTDTSFGTTTSFGISDIAGAPANVMYFAPSASWWGGYVMTHGIGGNGGGTNANQYTLIFDLLCPSSSLGGYRALFQTDPSNTDDDADAFFNPGNGLGISQTYQGTLTGDEWHRVTLAFDLTKREFGKYIDGTNVLNGPIGTAPLGIHDAQYLSNSGDPLVGGGVDLRWSLKSTALLLADQDGDLLPMYISSVQIRNGRMTDASIAAMGTPTANKIPGSIKAAKSGNSIVISWTGNVLESASSPTGPWTHLSGAAHPHVVATPTGNQFFRVRQ
ncbi:MAG TPA: LamG-like jellyroll fold domain-containing protein [Verrucomicrobiae bacterium]|nr:LamG-like jellyroll fold domain-containing protein [Verrucomicrobiae bacterium]